MATVDWIAILVLGFAAAFVLGMFLGLSLRRRRRSGYCGELPVNIQLKFEEIKKDKQDAFAKDVVAALKPCAREVVLKSESRCVAKGVTTCLGEVHSRLRSGVTTQPIEIKDHVVSLVYTSLQARGSVEISVTISATPGSTVHLDGVSQPISIGSSGVETTSVRISREQLTQGHITGRVVKGSLTRTIQIDI